MLDTNLICIPPYRMALTELKEFKAQLKDFQDLGYIQQSRPMRGAPLLFVKKNVGPLRMCID